jgi:hypothetical protein
MLCLGIFVLALAAVEVGCSGRKTVKVEGKVTLDGQPLAGAAVTFIPLDMELLRPAHGVTGSDGYFRLTTFKPNDGAMPGEYKIIVKKEKVEEGPTDFAPGAAGEPNVKMMAGGMQKHFEKMKQAGMKEYKPESMIPEVYGDPKRTPYQRITVPTDGPVDLALKSTGG